SLPDLLSQMPYRAEEDYERALERLSRLPAFTRGVIEATRLGLARGVVEARPVVEKVVAQLESQQSMAPSNHPFPLAYRSFPRAPPPLPPGGPRREARGPRAPGLPDHREGSVSGARAAPRSPARRIPPPRAQRSRSVGAGAREGVLRLEDPAVHDHPHVAGGDLRAGSFRGLEDPRG